MASYEYSHAYRVTYNDIDYGRVTITMPSNKSIASIKEGMWLDENTFIPYHMIQKITKVDVKDV